MSNNHSTLNAVALNEFPKQAAFLYSCKNSHGHAEPLVIQSPPGQGKSDMIENQLARELGSAYDCPVDVITDMPANRDPMDYKGFALPTKREGKAPASVYTEPDLVERVNRSHAIDDGIVVLFLDEFGQADHLTQKVLADLLLNYRLGEYQLPTNVWIVGATNQQSDGAGVNRILTHLNNRVAWYNAYLPMNEWASWARLHDIPAVGIAFAEFNERYFSQPEPTKDGPFLTYRSFTKAMQALNAYKLTHDIDDPRVIPDDAFLRRTVEGRIGVQHALSFFEYARVMEHLPKPQQVYSDPDNAPVPEDMAAMYAASNMVTELANRTDTPSHVEACVTYATRLPGDLAASALVSMNLGPNGGISQNCRGMAAWLKDHAVLLADVSKLKG